METQEHTPHEHIHQDIRFDEAMSDISSLAGSPPMHRELSRLSDRGPSQDLHRRPSFVATGIPNAHPIQNVIGPGHRIQEPQVQYVLVTPEMLEQMQHSQGPWHPAPGGLGDVTPGHTTAHAAPKTSSLPVHKPSSVQHFEHHPELESNLEQHDSLPANPLARLRHKYKDYIGEFIGTMILIIFGNGVNCQAVLSKWAQGQYLSISFGWGIGVMFGVYVCGGVSGGHINPAVTIALAAFRGFPWRKVPGYFLAQTLGACVGSCLVQGNYHALLNSFEGGYNVRTFGLETSTGALFFTNTQPYMTNVGAFFSEVLATAVLMGLILCLSDQNNNPIPNGMNGLVLLWLIVGIGAALGTETAYCLNPARDLGPRIACAIFGYPRVIWTYRNCYWIYTPIIATICGALIGAFSYDLFIFSGAESPLNRPWPRKEKTEKSGLAQV
ncbi:hypothetical protein CspeluHIS016_0700320 [Cutaneotrichosporon spelunceum]|uniref:Aquaporin n=1 Tax=Cutaneotrichosporon spelunceum TaxID=1672016 RepID=A0AAD3YEI2_9TREE|nr:hypothetical protein CspeluHIS016_0700320 [Cutaneotrichosporon spelunceum]